MAYATIVSLRLANWIYTLHTSSLFDCRLTGFLSMFFLTRYEDIRGNLSHSDVYQRCRKPITATTAQGPSSVRLASQMELTALVERTRSERGAALIGTFRGLTTRLRAWARKDSSFTRYFPSKVSRNLRFIQSQLMLADCMLPALLFPSLP